MKKKNTHVLMQKINFINSSIKFVKENNFLILFIFQKLIFAILNKSGKNDYEAIIVI
jgi:hypothetical protein